MSICYLIFDNLLKLFKYSQMLKFESFSGIFIHFINDFVTVFNGIREFLVVAEKAKSVCLFGIKGLIS